MLFSVVKIIMIGSFVASSLGWRQTLKRTVSGLSLKSFSESMGNSMRDTVYALSSGSSVVSGVAVVRISGPLSGFCLQNLLQAESAPLPALPKPRAATLRSLYCPKTKEMLDKALILWFNGPKSFTGEDVVELHLHGSRAVVSSVFSALDSIGDLADKGVIRPAENGEFTRRAFENGKMDLTEVEGLADLLQAETAEQRKQALRQMEGSLKIKYDEWRAGLLKCLAHTEAVIDFGDDDRESDIDDHAMDALYPMVTRLRNELLHHVQDNRRGEIIREGVQIALVGQPNAGKSSLINALARRPAAIVSPIAGTTRDIVEVRMDIDGIPCIIRDTAGLRVDAADPIEQEGIRRAREALNAAQIRVFVVDLSTKDTIETAIRLFQDNIGAAGSSSTGEEFRKIVVCNKIDLLPRTSPTSDSTEAVSSTSFANSLAVREISAATVTTPLLTSCLSGEGLSEFEDSIKREIDVLFGRTGDSGSRSTGADNGVFITRERHRGHVKRCIAHLDRFLSRRLPMDAAAEEIRLAMLEMGKVTGRVDVEELLDIIFRDFCIGK